MKQQKNISRTKAKNMLLGKQVNQLMLALLLSISALTSPCIFADENAPLNAENNYNGGYLKIGYGYKNEKSPYYSEVNGGSLFVNGRYQWEGLFVEVFHGANERNEGLSVGYNFYNTEHWNFDINTVKAHGKIQNEIHDTDKIFLQEFDSATMVGLRATGHYGQTTMQFLVAPYLIDDEVDDAVDSSLYASAWLGHTWQIKNWAIHGSVGLEYRSGDLLDYYYGISAAEASAHFGQYKAGAGIDLTTQLSASYPISKDWLFESYLRYTDLADSIDESPVVQFASSFANRAKVNTEFGFLVSYVF